MSSWIKVRTNLGTDPHVVRIAYACRTHPVRIVGACVTLWSVADAHADVDMLRNMSAQALDSMVDVPGFTAEMVSVGWIKEHEDAL